MPESLVTPWEILLRLVLALVLGGLIGLERESVEKPAGFRTHILVTLGAALFTLVSRDTREEEFAHHRKLFLKYRGW